MAEEVERGAFARQQAARRPVDGRDRLAGRHRAAVRPLDLDLDRGRNQRKAQRGDVEAGDDARLAGAQRERGALIGGNDRVRR